MCLDWETKLYISSVDGQTTACSRLSRPSSRIISSSRAPSPFAHVSTHCSHACSSSTNDQGRVQSNTIITRVCERDCRGGKKWGSKEVYEEDAEGTVYTDKRARVSVEQRYKDKRACPPQRLKIRAFISIVTNISKIVSNGEVAPVLVLDFV